MSIHKIVERASQDPEFLGRLSEDPLGTAQAEGYEVSGDQVKAALGMPGASDQEVAEALQSRLSHSGKISGGGSSLVSNSVFR